MPQSPNIDIQLMPRYYPRPTLGKAIQNCTAAAIAVLLGAFASPSLAAFRAILVGVSQFDHLPIQALQGPVNDVDAMVRALRAFGVPSPDIFVLTDKSPSNHHPSRANILRVLREQARTSQSGDWVIVYFSGHGAQIPQRQPVAKGRWVEPDGLDEVFLTRDTKRWDRKKRTVEGALLDDEIGDALAEFTAKGAHVWAIFDSCHAGDMMRSAPRPSGDVIWRGVDAAAVGVPMNLLARMVSAPSKRVNLTNRVSTPARGHRKLSAGTGHAIAFYATRPEESAPEEWYESSEFDAPNIGGVAQRRRYGVFTWELATALAKKPQTFADLSRTIAQQYQSRPFPTPVFEGNLSLGLLR